MKKSILLFFIVCIFVQNTVASENYIGVDERHEFTSIVWKLAEAQEYNRCRVPTYTQAIEEYFEPYKNHALIKYCQEIRAENGIGYDAIPRSTSFIVIENNRVKIKDGFCIDSISTIESRWTPKTFKRYVNLLDKFYRKSEFNKFFTSQEPLYNEAKMAFDDIIINNAINFKWYNDFFGKQPISYAIYLNINNGTSNYGGIKDPDVDVAIVLGCSLTKRDTLITYNPKSSIVITHELMHTFANPLAYKYNEEFYPILERIYPYIASKLTKHSYDKRSIMPEWFTRLSTIMYEMDSYPDKNLDWLIQNDVESGFIWQKDAVNLMNNFDSNRDKYPTFESFIPELKLMLDSISKNIDGYASDLGIAYSVPKIASITPKTNSVIDINIIDTLIIDIRFSEPMQYSLQIGIVSDYDTDKLVTLMKSLDMYSRGKYYIWLDATTFRIKIPTYKLKELACNGFSLGGGFVSENGVSIEPTKILYTFEY